MDRVLKANLQFEIKQGNFRSPFVERATASFQYFSVFDMGVQFILIESIGIYMASSIRK
jgi:hypothetical protein